jgi:hypothetical protein
MLCHLDLVTHRTLIPSCCAELLTKKTQHIRRHQRTIDHAALDYRIQVTTPSPPVALPLNE